MSVFSGTRCAVCYPGMCPNNGLNNLRAGPGTGGKERVPLSAATLVGVASVDCWQRLFFPTTATPTIRRILLMRLCWPAPLLEVCPLLVRRVGAFVGHKQQVFAIEARSTCGNGNGQRPSAATSNISSDRGKLLRPPAVRVRRLLVEATFTGCRMTQ